MPGIVGSIRIVSVSSGSIVHIGDAVQLNPQSTSKTFAGAGSFNTGDHIRTFNTMSATNTWECPGEKPEKKPGGQEKKPVEKAKGAAGGAGGTGPAAGPGVWPNAAPHVAPNLSPHVAPNLSPNVAPNLPPKLAPDDRFREVGQHGVDHPPTDYDP
jgi:hypothetical protein